MPNMFDALAQMADRGFDELPMTDMDALLMASVCYNRYGDLAAGTTGISMEELDARLDQSAWDDLPNSRQRSELLHAMAASKRYGQATVSHYVDIIDNSKPIQFSASVIRPVNGPVMVCFRGTDNTITGWREDMYMSFETPVPGQLAAQYYLKQVAQMLPGPIVLSGHSKGGNLAFYSSVLAPEDVQQRIAGAWSFDGPGLDEEMVASDAYKRIENRLHSFMPQGSVIGMMKTYQSEYSLITSTAQGLQQHDVFSWSTDGIGFVPAQKFTTSSRVMDKTLHTFLKSCTNEQRRVVVNALFDLLDATEFSTMHELKGDKRLAITRILNAARDMDPETLKLFMQVAGTLLQSGRDSVVDVAQDNKMVETVRETWDAIGDSPAADLVRGSVQTLLQNAGELKERLMTMFKQNERKPNDEKKTPDHPILQMPERKDDDEQQ